jgi:hypothetical protein
LWVETILFIVNTVSEVKIGNVSMLTEFEPGRNYPHSFNLSTMIRYGLHARNLGRLKIFNMLCQVVHELVKAEQNTGSQSVVWHTNVSSGLYSYRLEATSNDDPSERLVKTKMMLLLR